MSTKRHETTDIRKALELHGNRLYSLWRSATSRYARVDPKDRLAVCQEAVLALIENPDSKTARNVAQALFDLAHGDEQAKAHAKGYIISWANSRLRDHLRHEKREEVLRLTNESAELDEQAESYLADRADGRFAEFAERAAAADPLVCRESLHPDHEARARAFGRFLFKRLRQAPAAVRDKVIATLARLQQQKLEELARLYKVNPSTVKRWSTPTGKWLQEAVEAWLQENSTIDDDMNTLFAGAYYCAEQLAGFLSPED